MTDTKRTNDDPALAVAIRDAEAEVVRAAEALDSAWYIASVVDLGIGRSPLDRCVRELHALSEAVRALRAVRGGDAQ